MRRLSITLASVAAMTAVPALAQEASSRFSVEGSIELQSDFTVDSTDKAAEINNTFATIEAALGYAFTESTSLNATLLIEPIRDPIDDAFLEDHGFYAEELFFSHDFGPAEVVLGKFNPAFGTAWDVAPGIYGVDFAEDYEITEELGAALVFPFEAGQGAHELTVSVFTADRSFLSESVGNNRGRLHKRDGGVSNTGALESVAIALAGEIGNSAYNIGWQHQARGQGDASSQDGVVAGINHEIVAGSIPVSLLAEAAWFDDFDGTKDSAAYATFGIEMPIGPVSASAVYALRDVDNAPTDHLATLSGEIELFGGVTGALAYRFGDEGGEDSHTIGTLFAYEF